MTLTAPIPVVTVPHPPIRIVGRIYPTADTVDGWVQLLTVMRARIEISIIRTLQPTRWSILDGDIDWELGPEDGREWVVLTGTWVQR